MLFLELGGDNIDGLRVVLDLSFFFGYWFGEIVLRETVVWIEVVVFLGWVWGLGFRLFFWFSRVVRSL